MKKLNPTYTIKNIIFSVIIVGVALVAFINCGQGLDCVNDPANCSQVDKSTYTVGGSVVGLKFNSVTIQLNGGDNLVIANDKSFIFPTAIKNNKAYSVTILTQPADRVCLVSSGTGTISGSNINNVKIECWNTNSGTYILSGTLSGLTSGTITIITKRYTPASDPFVDFQDAVESSPLSQNGTFKIYLKFPSLYHYKITLSVPGGQYCSISKAVGTFASSNITDMQIHCAPTANSYTIGGSITGLSGASTGVTLMLNSFSMYSTTADTGTFNFPYKIASSGAYTVSVKNQPPDRTCAITNGTGNATSNVNNVAVSCSSLYKVGGTITGLKGTVSLTLNSTVTVALSSTSNGAYFFNAYLSTATAYSVALNNPTGQSCNLTGASGTISTSDVTNVNVSCTDNPYYVSGSIASGLSAGSSIQITLNMPSGSTSQTLTSTGTFPMPFAFTSSLAHNSTWSVTVTAVAGRSCPVTNGVGIINAANVTNVSISCSTAQYTIGGNLTGMPNNGSIVELKLTDAGGSNIRQMNNDLNGYTFVKQIAHGSTYTITVNSNPTGYTCLIASGAESGTATANVTNAHVNCTANKYDISGTISNQGGGNIVLKVDHSKGSTSDTFSAGTFNFVTKVAYGSTYSISVQTQPTGKLCSVTLGGSGTMGAANVSGVTLSCTNIYTVGGSISGLTGTVGLTLGGSTSDTMTRSANGAYTFSKYLFSTNTYSVSVNSQPTGQNCTVANGSGTIAATNVTNANITCVNVKYLKVSIDLTAEAVNAAAPFDCWAYSGTTLLARCPTSAALSAKTALITMQAVNGSGAATGSNYSFTGGTALKFYLKVDDNNSGTYNAGENSKYAAFTINATMTLSYNSGSLANMTSENVRGYNATDVTADLNGNSMKCYWLIPGGNYFNVSQRLGRSQAGTGWTFNFFEQTFNDTTNNDGLIPSVAYDIGCFVDRNSDGILNTGDYYGTKTNVTPDGINAINDPNLGGGPRVTITKQ